MGLPGGVCLCFEYMCVCEEGEWMDVRMHVCVCVCVCVCVHACMHVGAPHCVCCGLWTQYGEGILHCVYVYIDYCKSLCTWQAFSNQYLERDESPWCGEVITDNGEFDFKFVWHNKHNNTFSCVDEDAVKS